MFDMFSVTTWAPVHGRAVGFVHRTDPGVHSNNTGLPGLGTAAQIAGGLLTIGLIACVAGMAVSAVVWAFAHHSGNGRFSDSGKNGVLVCAVAAILIGGADAIITFFSNLGSGLH